MIRDDDENVFQAIEPPASGDLCKKPYEAPVLVEWGSIVDLTHGPAADIQDDGFSGSGGV